jgi:hypothetical protein
MAENVTERRTVRRVVMPESTGTEYETILRTQRETFQKILWAILSVLFVLLGIYALSGGQNPFLT